MKFEYQVKQFFSHQEVHAYLNLAADDYWEAVFLCATESVKSGEYKERFTAILKRQRDTGKE